MGRTSHSPKKITNPHAVSPSRKANSAPTRANLNAKLLLTNTRRREPICKPEAIPSQPPSPTPLNTSNTLKRRNDEDSDRNDILCDSNNGNSGNKDKERHDSKGDHSTTTATTATTAIDDTTTNTASTASTDKNTTTDTTTTTASTTTTDTTVITNDNNNSSSSNSSRNSSKRQSTGIAKNDKVHLRRTSPHHVHRRFSAHERPVCLKAQLVLWEPSALRSHSDSMVSTDQANTSLSTLPTPSATVYYTPTMTDTTETNTARLCADPEQLLQLQNNESLLRQRRLQKQLHHSHPEDVIDYFRTNKTAWGYLRSETPGIPSHGLYGTEHKMVLPDQHTSIPSGCLIGSHPDCDIRIPGLEHQHAYIYMNWTLVADGFQPVVHVMNRSTKGTFIDGKAMQMSTESPVEKGQTIQLVGENGEGKALLLRQFKKVEDMYHINELLGYGGFGEVWKATCRTTHRRVALKKIRTQPRPNEVELALCREVAINVCLKPHPCIIRLENVLEERLISQLSNGTREVSCYIYMAMELGKDGDLFEWVSSLHGLPEHTAKTVFDQLFHAIAHLHSQGIAHRDLKPENVIVTDKKTLQVKLCDFGVASFERGGEGFKTYCGTKEYSAPELLSMKESTNSKGYSKSVDIWSLGMLLYVTLAGYNPRKHDEDPTEGQTKPMLRDKSYLSSGHEKWKEISNEAKDLIQKMLTRDPSQRLDIDQVLSHPWAQSAQGLGLRNAELATYLAKHSH
ncbi:hypothetical protein [Absidia glauca]|uniref:Protein kinase domain-containing protein n=1 Tax=Absidia glauca TaxID=4829 RepID=A0A163KHY6_ABSGL|nr:hypothetical protein [Absidia glauca]